MTTHIDGNKVRKTVIVLGCNTGGLAAIRSLGRRGLHVIAMTHNPSDIGTASKYAKEVVWCPDPAHERECVEFLIDNAPRWDHPLIIESGDAYTKLLSKNKATLSDYYQIVTPEWEVASLFLEKSKTFALAESNNVPYPWTFEPKNIFEVEAVKDKIPFPCILKPILSHEFVKRFKTKVFILDSYDALKEKLQLCFNEGFEVMIQEIIPGDDSDFARVQVLFDTHGEIVAEFYNQKLRQSPPQFGQMRVGRSVPVDPEVHGYIKQLFKGVNYRGAFCSIEFRRDTRDNSLKLMEVNIRMPRSLQLIIASGIDVPWLLYQDYVLDKRIKIDSYKQTTWIELLPDVLNTVVRERRQLLRPIGLIRPYFAKNRTFAVLSLRDIRPFLMQFAEIPKRFKRESQRVKNLGNKRVKAQ